MKRKGKWRWWRADREELDRQRAECERLRVEGERLRCEVASLQRRVTLLTTLARALRDVNADLDGREPGT